MAKRLSSTERISWVSAWRHGATCALLSLLCCSSSWAKLGGDLASVQSEQLAWGAAASQTALAGATLVTQSLPNGLTVRQYLDAAGTVFAVAWDGPVLPDFERLLGSYYAAYSDAVRTQRRGVTLQNATLVIESGGMMRAFSGRAYLPAKLPATLTAQDIH